MFAPVISKNIYDAASLHDDTPKMGHIISARAENLVQGLFPLPPLPFPSLAQLKLSAMSESEGS